MLFNKRKIKHRKYLYKRIVQLRTEMVTISLKISLQDPILDKEKVDRLVRSLTVKGKLFRKYGRRDNLINF